MHDFLVQLQIYKPESKSPEKKLADYLQQHPDRTGATRILLELSAITGVSTATISRFAKALGYPSFQALKMALVQSTPEPDHTLFAELSPADSVETLAHKIFTSNIDALRTTLTNLDSAALTKAVDWITHANQVRPFWIGRQQSRGLGWLSQVLRTAIPVVYAADYRMQLMAANTSYCCRCDDFDFPLRQRQRCNRFGRTSKRQNVPLIVITGAPGSHLAKMADAAFVAVAEESRYRTGSPSRLDRRAQSYGHFVHDQRDSNQQSKLPLFRRVRSTIDATRQ